MKLNQAILLNGFFIVHLVSFLSWIMILLSEYNAILSFSPGFKGINLSLLFYIFLTDCFIYVAFICGVPCFKGLKKEIWKSLLLNMLFIVIFLMDPFMVFSTVYD